MLIKFNKIIFLVIIILCFICDVYATPVTVEFDITIDFKNNLGVKDETFSPIKTMISVTFDNIVIDTTDFGNYSNTSFGGATLNSPITQIIGENPYGVDPTFKYFTYGYVGRNEHPFFHEEISFQSFTNVRNPNNINEIWSYFYAIHMILISPITLESKEELNNYDYFFTPESFIDFIKDFKESGSTIYFMEEVFQYNISNNQIDQHIKNEIWHGKGYVSNIIETSETPEPSTIILFGIGILCLSFIHRKNILAYKRIQQKI